MGLFVDALGAGQIERAAALVGPASEQNAPDTGGLDSLLRESTSLRARRILLDVAVKPAANRDERCRSAT